MNTYTPKKSEIERTWHLVDAEGLVLGRMATEIATILRGKHKATYAPNIDTGAHVIVINADKVVLTSGKAERKIVYRHTGFPGGIKSDSYEDLLEKQIKVEGPKILFPYIRRLISQIMIESGMPNIDIKNINFFDLYKTQKKN